MDNCPVCNRPTEWHNERDRRDCLDYLNNERLERAQRNMDND